MNLNDDVVYRCRGLGPLGQLHPGRSRSLVRHHYRPHGNVSFVCLVEMSQVYDLTQELDHFGVCVELGK
jgi:hypothetical protein